jgi:hypothetical protein
LESEEIYLEYFSWSSAAFTFYVDKKVKAVEQRLQIFSFCNAEVGKNWAEEFKLTIEKMLVKNTNIGEKEKKL